MKHLNSIFSVIALLAATTAATAQEETNPGLEGYFRMSNPAFGDTFTASSQFSFGFDLASATDAGSVAYIKADELYNLIPELEALEAKLNNGEIDGTTYVALMQEMMTLSSWKSSYYPVQQLVIQGVDYAALMKELTDYADDAIEDFLNTEVQGIWENNYQDLMMMAIFTSGVIYPANYETPEALRLWFENYLTRWRSIVDLSLYLNPLMDTPDDPEAASYHNGKYLICFRTPQWVGNIKKAQVWFNSWKSQSDPEAAPLDIWASAMKRVLKAFAANHTEDSEAYRFVEHLLSNIEADMQYSIGEAEDGTLFCQPMPDVFGENGVVVTADEIAQIAWQFEAVDANKPFAVKPQLSDTDGFCYTTLCTGFAYEIASADVTAFYATAVNDKTGEPTLVEIAGGKVPAQTPVIIRSRSSEPQANCLIPVSEEMAAIEGNVLSGTLFARESTQEAVTFGSADGKPVFASRNTLLAANTAYYTGSVAAAIQTLAEPNPQHQIFDLQGRKVRTAEAHGFYIINGNILTR